MDLAYEIKFEFEAQELRLLNGANAYPAVGRRIPSPFHRLPPR